MDMDFGLLSYPPEQYRRNYIDSTESIVPILGMANSEIETYFQVNIPNDPKFGYMLFVLNSISDNDNPDNDSLKQDISKKINIAFKTICLRLERRYQFDIKIVDSYNGSRGWGISIEDNLDEFSESKCLFFTLK